MNKIFANKKVMDKKATDKKVRGWDYILLALTAFGGLGMEVLYAWILEPNLLGFSEQMSEWSVGQAIFHWILTCITWGLFAWYAISDAKKSFGFDIFEQKSKLKKWQWCAVAVCIVVAIASSYVSWDGFKIIEEFKNKGALLFTFQYIYYAFETVLFMLIIVFAQKAFETWFKNDKIPYGGIVCGLTWGLAHAFTKGSLLAGMEGIFFGFLLGTAYLFAGRDIKRTYVILFIMFAC